MFEIGANPYKLVALDIGNTLIRQFRPGLRHALGLTDKDDISLGVEPFQRPFEKILLGEVTEEEYLQEFYDRFNGRWSREEILKAHEAYLLPSIDGMPELIGNMVATGTHFVFFSDINPIHFRRFRALTVGEYDFITDAIRSDEVHALKPSEEMFHAFEERFGKPDLYLDDRVDLVNVANARGWYAVQTGNTETLYRKLFEKGGNI